LWRRSAAEDRSPRFCEPVLELERELRAERRAKARLPTKLEPTQTQQMSEALQQADEFRKYVVAGYNACAVTKDQYARFGARFQALDALERRIAQLPRRSR